MSLSTRVQLADVRRAWEAQDPQLVRLVCLLAEQPDEPPDPQQPPPRQGAPTFAAFLGEIRGYPFRKKTPDERKHFRVERIKALESPAAEVPLPDRLRLHEIIYGLWQDNGPFARWCLLEVIAQVKLAYGPWRALKRIFKEAEEHGDTEVWGALAARFDSALASRGYGAEMARPTLAYLARRAWRHLRRTGVTLPAAYADVACDVLAWYRDETDWLETWVANHVFFHETGDYTRGKFKYTSKAPPSSLTKHRAFAELWQRTPRPLFSLLERAKSDRVRQFAAEALKADFRAALREVEPAWVARLVGVGSAAVDDFVVWILTNVPRFEQGAFRQLGLHETVLRLLDSESDEAAKYAAGYARTHARDLPLDRLVRLANRENEAVRKVAGDLLLSRDPRKEVGLETWTALLGTEYGHEMAAGVLKKHFGAKELTPEWFKGRLLSESDEAFEFASELLPQVHPFAKLGPAFFADLIDSVDAANEYTDSSAAEFALEQLARFDLDALDPEFLKRLLVNPLTSDRARQWINEGRLKVQSVPVEFFKALAYHPLWEADPWLAQLRSSGRQWARRLRFGEGLADEVLGWMRDVRRFSPSALSFEWLMQLVARPEARYHDFAVELMIKAYTPADFAPKGTVVAKEPTRSAAPQADFQGASFVFTGKLATMQRKEAEDKVRGANGVPLDAVSAKLHYLVIGDEGSPLYGAGKKGSKQLKAEQLNAGGANIRIISETAFLKMLAGEKQEATADASLPGAQRLWEMATAPGAADAAVAAFARKYVLRHHPDIALAETDRPVDPGTEIPASFLTFERVRPLFAETRKALRELALALAKWEFARWAPPAEEIVRLSELPFEDVRQFVARALLAEDAPEHRRYRIDPAVLTPAAVYSFVESADEATRELGMELIRRQPRLQLPEELFRLSESPDRKVRAFVIKALRALYRDRGITQGWKPAPPQQQPTVGATARKTAALAVRNVGDGPPARPEKLPAEADAMRQFLRRILFEVPPGRLPPERNGEESEAASGGDGGGRTIRVKLKPLPARKAKLALVEVIRDVAVDDVHFAGAVLPLLEEFMGSRGRSEHDATLVAVTRVRQAHGLVPLKGEGAA